MNHNIDIILFISLFILTDAISAKKFYKIHLLNEKHKSLVLNPTFFKTVDTPSYKLTKNIKVYDYIFQDDDHIDEFIKNKSIDLIRTDNDFVTCKKNELTEKYFNRYNIDQTHCKFLQNKQALRSYLSKFHEINNVKSKIFTNDKYIVQKLKRIEFDNFIVKPTCGAGSGGVFNLYRENNDIINLDKFKDHRNDNIYIKDVCNTYIAEEFIGGSEHNLDLVIFKNEIYFWHISDDSVDMQNFQDIQTIFPSSLKNEEQINMFEQAKFILKRLNILNGVYHFEFKYYKDKAYLIELNPRCPGGNYVEYISKLYGNDLEYDDMLIALDKNHTRMTWHLK